MRPRQIKRLMAASVILALSLQAVPAVGQLDHLWPGPSFASWGFTPSFSVSAGWR